MQQGPLYLFSGRIALDWSSVGFLFFVQHCNEKGSVRHGRTSRIACLGTVRERNNGQLVMEVLKSSGSRYGWSIDKSQRSRTYMHAFSCLLLLLERLDLNMAVRCPICFAPCTHHGITNAFSLRAKSRAFYSPPPYSPLPCSPSTLQSPKHLKHPAAPNANSQHIASTATQPQDNLTIAALSSCAASNAASITSTLCRLLGTNVTGMFVPGIAGKSPRKSAMSSGSLAPAKGRTSKAQRMRMMATARERSARL